MSAIRGPDQCSSTMKDVLAEARRVAKSVATVLLLGETGSGKDYLARYIHDHSERSAGPFYSINCAAIPPELVESEFFGHEKGAFTGAFERKPGLIELAEDGTLVLNEIGEIPLPLQAKLLSFLETKAFVRVGGRKEVHLNVRIIAATNRELDQMVSDGSFRRDLYYRLNVFPIVVPPLRDRKEDIQLLTRRLLTTLAAEMGLQTVPSLEPAALEILVAYYWPGNVRELRNVLERALICSGGHTTIVAEALGFLCCIAGDPTAPPPEPLSGTSRQVTAPAPPPSGASLDLVPDPRSILDDDEQFARMILELFGEEPTPIGAIAAALGCSRKTVSERIKRLGLPAGDPGRMRKGTKQQIVADALKWIEDNPVCATRWAWPR